MSNHRFVPRLTTLGAAAATALLAGCGGHGGHGQPGTPPPATHSMDGMARKGGASAAPGAGLVNSGKGYAVTVRTPPTARGNATTTPTTFVIAKDGVPITAFDTERTALMHFYLIRSDLTGFQHLHPSMSPDGTWSAPTAAVSAGDYRGYVQFVPSADAAGGPLTLSAPIKVAGPGDTAAAALPAAAPSTTVDGYTLTLSGTLSAGRTSTLNVAISRDGQPVTNLQPYLGSYAHVTAIRQGDLAFAHVHPSGAATDDRGGPNLTVRASLPAPGAYRMFIQFRTDNVVHTAPITVATS